MQKKQADYKKFKEFPKNYDYAVAEPRISNFWEEKGIYKFKPGEKGKTGDEKPVFSVDTPPPYVSSAHLHVGHVMSYSQAEFIVRYKRMRGFNVFYPMGFDDNGLPTERYVEKKYKINKSKITREEFIELCLKETKEGIETYKALWKAAGIGADYGLSYSTIDERCRKAAQKSFIELFDKRLIERRNDPILWCPKCRTSLAQADIAINESRGTLYDISFQAETGETLVISTTRPELIGACVAIYANPSDERYKHLKDKKVITPIYKKAVPVMFDESVETDYGTGLMMVCTWGDMEDVRKWKEHRLDTVIIMDRAGRLNESSGDYSGMKANEAKSKIISDLKALSLVTGEKTVDRNVGVHDRCDTPVEFIQAFQWFVKILDSKERFIKVGDEMGWHPQFMKHRYFEWVNNLKWDWNISRQRFYGVPFPVWYCKGCGKVVLAKYDELPVDPVNSMPPLSKCPECGGSDFIPETDVMDTWMTSSLTPLINSGWTEIPPDNDLSGNKIFPMGLRPQAQEIIRTWLFYTVIKSIYHTGSIPFDNIMVSGWGLDKNGRKMSKSMGNFVEPEGIIVKYSADALRFWASRANLGQDLRFSEDDVANGRKLLIKIWNAARFLITNIDEGFSPAGEDNLIQNLGEIDKWVISEFEKTVSICTEYMESYEYSSCLKAISDYFYNIYCDNYLEIVKNVFWEEDVSSRKETVLNVMYFISLNSLKIFAPFFPFITEELYQAFFVCFENEPSIHLTDWPLFKKELLNEESVKIAGVLLNILEASRKVRTSMNLHQNHKLDKLLIKTLNENDISVIENLEEDIKSAARVKRVIFSDEAGYSTADGSIFIGLVK